MKPICNERVEIRRRTNASNLLLVIPLKQLDHTGRELTKKKTRDFLLLSLTALRSLFLILSVLSPFWFNIYTRGFLCPLHSRSWHQIHRILRRHLEDFSQIYLSCFTDMSAW